LALILIFGATVISWKSPSLGSLEPTERLFLSSKSALDGSKAVRGGIPVVFPCFGAPTHKEHLALKQHGFARSERWVYDGVVMDNDAGVAVRFGKTAGCSQYNYASTALSLGTNYQNPSVI